jgi:hypothetical protein
MRATTKLQTFFQQKKHTRMFLSLSSVSLPLTSLSSLKANVMTKTILKAKSINADATHAITEGWHGALA